MSRKSSLLHLLNVFIMGGLAFTGIYLLKNSSNDPLFKPKSSETTVDSGSKIAQESGQVSPHDNKAMQGKIMKVTAIEKEQDGHDIQGYLTINVVSLDGVETGASIAIMDDTPIFKQAGQALQTASFDDLKNGQTVDVELKGPALQTYPIQAGAERVFILDLSE